VRLFSREALNEAASRQKKPEIVRKDKLGHRAWVHLEVNPIHNWELHALRRPKADDQHTRVRPSSAAKKESGSLVRGTEKSDRVGRLRLRRLKFVREQFFLTAVAQNLKRLVRFLSFKPTLQIATA